MPVQQLLRYGAVGLANTAIGFGLIWLGLRLGMGDYAANIFGFAAGLIFSFFANRRFTFQVAGNPGSGEAVRFGGCFVVAYAANLLVITAGRAMGLSENPLLHLSGMVVYSGLFFLLMRGYAFRLPGSTTKGIDISQWAAENAPHLGLAGLTLVSLAMLYDNPLTHDVVWQFWIARQMLGGAEIYRDIWEVNPPLWFWSAIPLEALASLTQVPPFRFLISIMVGLSAFGAYAVDRLHPCSTPLRRFSAMAATLLVCLSLDLFDFGQREQFALIGAVPYAALIAARRQGRAVSTGLALAIGLVAAYGFALKHYFVLVPVALEVWLLWSQRRSWNPLRPETLALGISAAAYGIMVLLFAPAFFEIMVPMVQIAYGGYETPWWQWVDEPSQIIWLMTAVGLWRAGKVFGRDADPFTGALVITALGFLGAYFAQMKGWQYHALPVSAALTLAMIHRIASDPEAKLKGQPIALLALAYTALLSVGHGHYRDFLRGKNEAIVQLAEPGETVAILSSDPMWTWPIAEENGLRWPFRYYSLWMLPSMAQAERQGHSDPALDKLADEVRRTTLSDMRCSPPAVIMFERATRYEVQPKGYLTSSFFLRDEEFAAFVAENYRREMGNWYFDAYRLKRPIEPENGPHCRQVSDPQWTVTRYNRKGRIVATLAPPTPGR